MLINLIRNGFTQDALIQILLFIPVILISLTVHEYCHGYAAYLCGDNTAKWNGRLTLNPVKHLDPIGTIMMLLFGFGYVLHTGRKYAMMKTDNRSCGGMVWLFRNWLRTDGPV